MDPFQSLKINIFYHHSCITEITFIFHCFYYFLFFISILYRTSKCRILEEWWKNWKMFWKNVQKIFIQDFWEIISRILSFLRLLVWSKTKNYKTPKENYYQYSKIFLRLFCTAFFDGLIDSYIDRLATVPGFGGRGWMERKRGWGKKFVAKLM